MSTVIAEKATPANDNVPARSKSNLECDASNQILTTGSDAKSGQAHDKCNDNDCAVDTQLTSLTRPDQSPSKEQIGKNGGSDVAQSDGPSQPPDRRPSTTSRFKEKRPVPLKLNPNQEIPLDLSVKSAGNVPSGNIFNLAPMNNLMGPLETPRIQWQDNETILTRTKSRLFSSSTSTSQRARIQSLMGESPPITPNTPLADLIFSPSGASLARSCCEMPHSASLVLESPFHTLFMSPFELSRIQLMDKSSQAYKPLIGQVSKRFESRITPRRSSSTDDLDVGRGLEINRIEPHITDMPYVNQDGAIRRSPSASLKKNSVSPLATKGDPNYASATDPLTKFTYTNQHLAKNKKDAPRSSSSSSNSSTTGGKSLTPTSVANATANLLNINLNSPNAHSPTNQIFDANKHSHHQNCRNTNLPASFDQEPSPLDPLISAVSYCHQQHQQQRSLFTGIPSSGNESDQNINDLAHFHQLNRNSHSSTATLNTPTLISPSQLKTGQMCFLPSPTLSPMSSVFELPSPLLMFPPTSSLAPQQQRQQMHEHCQKNPTSTLQSDITGQKRESSLTHYSGTNKTTSTNSNRIKAEPAPTLGSNLNGTTRRSCSENDLPLNDSVHLKPGVRDLSQLITTAAQKGGAHQSVLDKEDEDEINMEIDADNSNPAEACESTQNQFIESRPDMRPVTVIPQICVSNHHLNNRGKFVQRESCHNADSDLNPLSPKSYWYRLDASHNERHESSSAPPEVHQPRVKARLKTITADSCFDLVEKNIPSGRTGKLLGDINNMQERQTSLSQSNISHSIIRRDRSSSKPYPDIGHKITASSQQLNKSQSGALHSGARSNSAEPAVYLKTDVNRAPQHITSSSQNENFHDSQVASQPHLRENFSNSAQQLTYANSTDTRGHSSSNSLYNQQQQLSSTNHQLLCQQQRTRWEQQNLCPQPIRGQELNYQHQQNSISVSDLHRLQSGHGCSSQTLSNSLVAFSNDAIAMQNDRHHHNISHIHFFQQGQQMVPSTSARFDHLAPHNGYYQQRHQQLMQHARQNAAQTMTTASDSIPRFEPTNQHTAVPTHLLAEQFETHEALCRNTMNPMVPNEQKHHLPPQSHASSVEPSCKQTAVIHCAYALESESRSESRSSSLDFTSSFNAGGGGSNHSTGSNLVAKKYHCDHCAKSFTRSDMLTRHRRLHSGDRPFQCSECKQEFSRSDHLSTHMRTHTGEKPYKCKLCSYSACRKDMITRHLKVHTRGPNGAEAT